MMQAADLVAWGFPYTLSHQDSELSKPMSIRNSLLFNATSAGQFRNGRGPSPKSRGEKGILTRAFPGGNRDSLNYANFRQELEQRELGKTSWQRAPDLEPAKDREWILLDSKVPVPSGHKSPEKNQTSNPPRHVVTNCIRVRRLLIVLWACP
jgi:hypothetical protein